MSNLVELFDNIVQMQNLNGVPLANGKMYVYALGRTRLMDTWSDVDGESLNSNPIILDAAGQCHCYVSDDFDYTLVITDAYDNEIFSIDKYLYSQGSHSHTDVAVAPSETIAVSSYHVGETTVYVPYLTGQLGKVYTGIDPIVVNNTEDKISANHVPLGVQDPLYFVQDDEEGCIIGFSGQTIPEGVMSESALGFENNKITGYNGSAFSAGNEYEAGSYVDITDNTISVTGLQPEGDYAYNSALSSKLDVTALPQDLVHSGDLTAYQPAGDYQTAGDYLSASDSANFLLTSDSGKFYPMEGNPSGFLTAHQSLDGYATEQWVENKGYLTGVDIPESASWNEATTVVNNNSAIWNNTTNVVSSKSAQWGASNPQIPVTGINGIKISESGDKVVFEVSGDYATHEDVESATNGLFPSSAVNGIVNGIFNNVFANTVEYRNKPTADAIQASYNSLVNVGEIVGLTNSNFYIVPSGVLQVPNIITATTAGLAAAGLSAMTDYGLAVSSQGVNFSSNSTGLINSGTNSYFSAGIDGIYNLVQYNTSLLISGGAGKIDINLTGGSAVDNNGNKKWQIGEADHLWSFANGNPSYTAKPIVLSYNTQAGSAYAPYFMAGPGGFTSEYIQNNDTLGLYGSFGDGIKYINQVQKASAILNYNDVQYKKYNSATSATDTWSLTDSIQKRELEYDADTSAITAIAGSAIGGTGGTGGGGELPESVSAATDYVTANSANIDATVSNVSANSGAWGGSALPISAGPGVDLSVSDNKLVISAVPSAFYTVGISNIILTASLPVSPDANTLYLIKE